MQEGVGAAPASTQGEGNTPRWHWPFLLAVSVGFEALFFRHGMNRLDEGWPLAAAAALRAGGTLYQDVFFVFPPGHLLPAWLGAALDPPGLLVARAVYLAFDVAAVLGLYALGRRVMPARYALFGALLLAVGAPASHLKQLLFGYRYLALGMLGLLAFARRIEGGPRGWTLAAGAAIGALAVFRLTPALATAGAVALGFVAADPRPRAWLREGGRLLLGAALVAGPVYATLLLQVGPEVLVRELLVRPVVMTDLQSLPLPSLALPDEWTRRTLRNWFVAVQFRGFALLYAVYVVVAGVAVLRRRGDARAVLLFTLVVWGAVYFTRSLGRSDEPHLDSALPPVCLLLGHALSQLRRVSWPDPARLAVCVATFGAVAFLWGSDFIAHPDQRGKTPFRSTGGRVLSTHPFVAGAVDWCVLHLQRWSQPGDVVLDLSASPLLVLLAGRTPPGGNDLIMPGTFLDEAEERAFLARLERRPPALVIWPTLPFDHRADRGIEHSAPRVTAWVRERYAERGRRGRYALWAPKGSW
ncbi:MAG: hypothetical protein ACQGVC_10065 [Myxococcota bacterium]